MMPNVTRGASMRGLLGYLAGPGKANEHTSPRLVAGDAAVRVMLKDVVLDAAAAREVAAQVDRPRRLFDVEVPRGSVWHCSLSVRADDKAISLQTWGVIAHQMVAEMGFTATEKRAGCRWVAVHHGRSKEGNDHIHLAVSLVREDGSIASTWNDFSRAQQAAGKIEARHHLAVLASRGAGLGERGIKPAEVAKAQRVGEVEPERVRIARTVRACAAAAAGEGDFVARARAAGLVVRARYSAGGRDVVVGYSAALRPAAGQAPVWFGGGRLARDLTLARLREGWSGREGPGVGSAGAEWAAAAWGVSPAPAAEVQDTAAAWAAAREQLAALGQGLVADPLRADAWAHVGHHGAGLYAAWSRAVEPVPGPLAETSRELARMAGIRAHRTRAIRASSRPGSARMATALLTAAARGRPADPAVLGEQAVALIAAVGELSAAIAEARASRAHFEHLRELRMAFMGPALARGPGRPAAASSYETPDYVRRSYLPSVEQGRGFGR